MNGRQSWWYRGGLTLLSLLVLGVPALATTISGNVNYTGNKNGRLYVSAKSENGGNAMYGVSVPLSQAGGSTHYEIRGVPEGNYVISGVLDTMGNQALLASNPHGNSALATVSGTSVEIDFSLVDPVPPQETFQAPQLEIIPGDGALLLHWEAERDQHDLLLDDEVYVYWSTDADVMGTYATLGGSLFAPVTGRGTAAVVNGLTNGIPYNFVIFSRRSGIWSQSFSHFGVMPSAPMGSETYAINVNVGSFPPPSPGGRVYVILENQSGAQEIYFASTDQVDAYGNATVYVNNVGFAEYRIMAAYDVDNNGLIDYFDRSNFNGENHPLTSGFGGSVDLLETLSGKVTTWNEMDESSAHKYALKFTVSGQGVHPVNVKLVGGPQIAGPIDIAMDEDGEFELTVWVPSRPQENDSYNLAIETVEGGTVPMSLGVTRVVDNFPMPKSPVGPQPYDWGQPLFSWDPPALPPAFPYSFALSVEGNNSWWGADQIQTTMVSYNFNNEAVPSYLSDSQCYRWRVALCDAEGNCASPPQQTFTYGTGVCVDPGSVTPTTVGFESGIMEPGWNSYGYSNWYVTSDSVYSGMYAMRSGLVSDGNSSMLETTQITADGQISFWFRVSSDYGDSLRFYIDGMQQSEWSGEQGWFQASFPVNAGMHTFRWEYSKDWNGMTAGADAAWIDDVSFPVATVGEPVPVVVTNGVDWKSSINDLGEIVWSRYDSMTGYSQIYSSIRGPLTSGADYHNSPSINNLGEVVWEQNGAIYGQLLGQGLVQITANGSAPDVNDHGEVVWTQYDPIGSSSQVFSSRRGQLTFDQNWHDQPTLANDGTVVWTSNGNVYRLAPGTTEAEIVASGDIWGAAISNSGEIVYQKMVNGYGKVFSTQRGQVTFSLPAGMHERPEANACGDVIFSTYSTGSQTLYRLGNNAPCLDIEPNNEPAMAAVIGYDQTMIGKVDAATDSEDWYQFEAQVGDSLSVAVNIAAVDSYGLAARLFDQNGTELPVSYGAAEPNRILMTLPIAPYSGNYRVQIQTLNGSNIGYALGVKRLQKAVVQSPNGGETFVEGTTIVVNWTAATGAEYYNLGYSLDGGATWTFAKRVQGVTGTSWKLPEVNGDQTNCLVRVTAYDAALKALSQDTADMSFTISDNVPVVVQSPNGGETFVEGTPIVVSWTAATGAEYYNLGYSLDGGATWTFAKRVQGVTSTSWKLPDVTDNQANCLVRITAYDAGLNSLSQDASNSTFSITNKIPVAVLSPNGGEVLIEKTTVIVSWTAATGAEFYNLGYSLDGGATWTFVKRVQGVTSTSWKLPDIVVTQPNCLVRITAYDAALTKLSQDVSATPFTIMAQ